VQSKLDSLAVVLTGVIMDARFKCRDAVMLLKMVVLGLECAEEALYHRVVMISPLLFRTRPLRNIAPVDRVERSVIAQPVAA